MNNNEVCTMTMNAKLLVAALGLLAIAATPAAAAAKTHHVRTHHSHIVRVAPPAAGWEGAYGYAPGNVPTQSSAQGGCPPGFSDRYGCTFDFNPARGERGPGNGPYWQGEPTDHLPIWRYGYYQGNDPDNFIRGQLMRDPLIPFP
jgi:hypothetical protein